MSAWKKLFTSLTACLGVINLLSSCGTTKVIKSDSLIVVKDIDIPSSERLIAQFATHTFLDYRASVDEPWQRIEIEDPKSGIVHKRINNATVHANKRWGERVRVLSQSNGQANSNFVKDIRAFAARYDDSVYRSYPGPNSNTFIAKMIRKVDGVSAILDHNAVGKESGFYVGKSTGGTGVKVQTPIVGFTLGFKEGVELNALGMSAGVSIVPLSVRIPFLPKIPTWE